jgi:hypothetical protein
MSADFYPVSLYGFMLLAYNTYERVYVGDGYVYVKGEAAWPDGFFKDVAAPVKVGDDAANVAALAAAFGIPNAVKVKPAREATFSKSAKEAGIGLTAEGRNLFATLVDPAAAASGFASEGSWEGGAGEA